MTVFLFGTAAMRRIALSVTLLLASAPGLAQSEAIAAGDDDLATMNAVSQAWDRYAALTSHGDPAGAALVAASGVTHYRFLRDAALAGSAEQIRRLPLADRAMVYVLRATRTDAQLEALDGPGIVQLCVREGWCGVAPPGEDDALPRLSHVTVIAPDRAIGELGAPTGSQFQFGPEFVREDGTWKVLPQSMAADASAQISQQIRQQGISETQMLEVIVADFSGGKGEAPTLATLDRPLRDDPAARTRLNETWPEYQATYKTRLQALEKKAADGDGTAQLLLGLMLYGGRAPQLIAQDRARGLKLLEQASDGGNADAANAVAADLLAGDDLPPGKPIPPARLARALPHLRRSAAHGLPEAMSQLGSFYFNGVAGLPRDCTQAEEWAARAEDAGLPKARNDRVWALAVCPIPEQRDPQRAFALVAHMVERADQLSAGELDTIAAAMAANNKFTEAVDYQQRAIARLEKDAETGIRRGMNLRLKAYRNRQDWVQRYNAYETLE